MDDDDRYREMLQKSLLAEGWEETFDFRLYREAMQRHRDRLRARAVTVLGDKEAAEYDTHVTAMIERFVPRSQYDLPATHATFRPLFDAVIHCAREMGLQPIREVELVTSTSILPTALARPTNGVHQLFVGLGTSTFCNYWAKAFAALITSMGTEGPPYRRVESREDLDVHLSRDPRGLILATRLALYYAAAGTLLGFGEVEEPRTSYAYRTQLLSAMEVFVIAHEYAHFVAEERGLEFADKSGKPQTKVLEFFCDELGLQITRDWGSRHNNWLAFTGSGAIVLFSALDISEKCAAHLARYVRGGAQHSAAIAQADDSSHPSIDERVLQLIAWIIDKTADDQREGVKQFLEEIVVICNALKVKVIDMVSRAIEGVDDGTEGEVAPMDR